MTDTQDTQQSIQKDGENRRRQMEDIMQKSDLLERHQEKEFAEKSRPIIVGGQSLKWDGMFLSVSSLWDKLVWMLVKDDVKTSKK